MLPRDCVKNKGAHPFGVNIPEDMGAVARCMRTAVGPQHPAASVRQSLNSFLL
jgi:hypothetical protein